uniref:Uncharacterized protein n=1 Tax=Anas platyrhynchos TaxID=8839 RepID=A0A8B9T873_ANAPL
MGTIEQGKKLLKQGPRDKDSWKCCPEGWRPFQESCYYFSDDQMPWDKSQQNCSGMDSQLVVINTKAEQVSAGLGEGQSSLETGVPGLEGLRAPPGSCSGGGMSLLHALSTGSSLPPAPPHWDSCHLPLFSPEPHGRCTLPDFQDFLYKEIGRQMKYQHKHPFIHRSEGTGGGPVALGRPDSL